MVLFHLMLQHYHRQTDVGTETAPEMSLQRVCGTFSFFSDERMKDPGRKEKVHGFEENKCLGYHNMVCQFYDFVSILPLRWEQQRTRLGIPNEKLVLLPGFSGVLPASVVDVFFHVLTAFVVGASAI